MKQTLRTTALATALAAMVGGCATDNPAAKAVMDNAKGVQDAKSCCESLAAVLATSTPLADGPPTMFGPSARHFDFGKGLTPFVVHRLPASVRTLEAEAPLQLLGWAYGGDGVARYVEIQALFYDANGAPLASTAAPERGQRMSAYSRSLFQYFEVPSSAAVVVVTTDPSRNGTHDLGPIYNMPLTPISAGGKTGYFGLGLLPHGYRLANYGPVLVRALPNG